MEILCHSHPLENPVLFYVVHVLLEALDEADHVDANFCCNPVARLVSARGRHHIAMIAHSDY